MKVKCVKVIDYSGVTVDIEVEKTHSYQLANGLVTHNSTSAMLGTGSGIHPHHAKRYLRRVQSNKLEAPANFYSTINPVAVEESAWSASKNEVVISFYCESSENAIVSRDVTALQLLEKVKFETKS
jgi:ribonucleoside-diphosphate reductase alpha chain